ncbi:MAG TPA: proline dehydrogenase family protein [Thermomicrobiaceae bacterium]|nr:proline dehydrogenase family protein [Thermomicrobiaceae bacterium]
MTAVRQDRSSGSGWLEGVSGGLNPLFRKLILTATHNRLVSKTVRRYGMRFGAARFVAGESFEEAIPVLRSLNQQGLKTNTTLLGEGVSEEATATSVTNEYVQLLDRIAAEKLNTVIALKLTHLGLDLSEDVAYGNIKRLVTHAAELNTFMRIDMEESARVDPTLRIYRRLRADGLDNVGTVLQSALYRTRQDLEALLPLEPNLRLVKGAYLEPPDIAFPKKADVDRNYLMLAERKLLGGGYTAIATHDERIINHVIEFTQRHDVANDRFEFQMLYGIRSQLQLELVRQGYTVLVATPFGQEWYFYLMRRLAERPANLLFVLRGFRG